jgi:hypothetical protein
VDITTVYPNIHTYAAIEALKHAYDQCTNLEAKKSIITAFKAVARLHHDLGSNCRCDVTYDSEELCDPSEYCAAV